MEEAEEEGRDTEVRARGVSFAMPFRFRVRALTKRFAVHRKICASITVLDRSRHASCHATPTAVLHVYVTIAKVNIPRRYQRVRHDTDIKVGGRLAHSHPDGTSDTAAR